MRHIASETSGLIVPRECPCGREGAFLCTRCAGLLRVPPVRVDAVCDALQIVHRSRLRETPEGPAGVDHRALLPVLALGEYSGDLQRLVLGWKNGGLAHLARPMAQGLAPAVAMLCSGAQAPVLVPVPSRLGAQLRRGEHHTGELARALARCTSARSSTVGLRLGHGQRGHGARERRGRSAVLTGTVPGGGPLILVDDVVTTGSTLRAVVQALRAGGAEVRGAVVVASARLPAPAAVPGSSR